MELHQFDSTRVEEDATGETMKVNITNVCCICDSSRWNAQAVHHICAGWRDGWRAIGFGEDNRDLTCKKTYLRCEWVLFSICEWQTVKDKTDQLSGFKNRDMNLMMLFASKEFDLRGQIKKATEDLLKDAPSRLLRDQMPLIIFRREKVRVPIPVTDFMTRLDRTANE